MTTQLDTSKLTRWAKADNYMGEDLSEYFIAYSKHRDSVILDRANFDEVLYRLSDSNGEILEGVRIDSFGHWAVGWVESIFVHESATEALEELIQIQEELEQYPVLDDERYNELEQKEMEKIWFDLFGLNEKIQALREHGDSIFASRAKSLYDLYERAENTYYYLETIAHE